MKKVWYISILTIICAVAVVFGFNSLAQEQVSKTIDDSNNAVVIKEAKSPARNVAAAPDECLQTFHNFFKYIQKHKPDIAEDEKAQQKWLTLTLREAIADKVKRVKENLAKNPEDKPDYPDNALFVGAWDYPSSYSVVGSRQYNNRAIVDVLYTWGAGKNYEGDTRLMSFLFVKEDGAWKLDDTYTFRGEFVTAESLSQDLREN